MDDGIGWAEDEVAWGTKFLRIRGDESFDGDDVEEVEGWPFTPGENTFYGYGTYSVDGRIYTWLWKRKRRSVTDLSKIYLTAPGA
jgi:hypothetical protein